MTAWASAVGRTDRPVVLAGLAGGLTDRAETGRAFAVTRVIDGVGGEWTSPLAGRLGAQPPDLTLIGTNAPVAGAAAKRALAEEHGADLVDMESVGFATAATALGWTWGIVRGVSDGPSDELPADSADWIDPRGRTRVLRVAGRVARSPSLLPRLITLRRHGEVALQAVAARLAGLG